MSLSVSVSLLTAQSRTPASLSEPLLQTGEKSKCLGTRTR